MFALIAVLPATPPSVVMLVSGAVPPTVPAKLLVPCVLTVRSNAPLSVPVLANVMLPLPLLDSVVAAPARRCRYRPGRPSC